MVIETFNIMEGFRDQISEKILKTNFYAIYKVVVFYSKTLKKGARKKDRL